MFLISLSSHFWSLADINNLFSEERYSELGENIYLRENSIYTIADGSSWSSAQASAKKLGGDLVTVNNLEENIFIFETFGFNQSTKETINTGYWIGLTDQELEGDWKWISGEENNWMSAGFQPGVYGYEPKRFVNPNK